MHKIKTFLAGFLAVCCALAAGCLPSYDTVADKTAEPTSDQVVIISEPTDEPGATAAQEITAAPTAEATATPQVTDEPTPEPTATPVTDPYPGLPYYLYVEKGSFTLTIYGKDENYNYTVIINQYRIGHGDTKTPVGKFTLSSTRHRWYTFRLGGSVQYATAYWGNLYIHSPLYGSENAWNMWPKYYNGEYGIGTAHTGGCLRMVTAAAKFIYENCPTGTVLEIVNGSPRGTTSPDVPPMTKYGYDPTDVEANGG